MQKLALIISMLFACSSLIPIQAQKADKELNKDLKSRAIKKARKDTKQNKKEGFYYAPDALPMDKQFENAWMKEMETNDNGFPFYIVATGQSVGETKTAAKIQATETAKQEHAGTITTNMAALIENSIAIQQLNADDAASVTKTVAASKNIIAQKLGRVLPLFEVYKEKGHNIESSIRLAYIVTWQWKKIQNWHISSWRN